MQLAELALPAVRAPHVNLRLVDGAQGTLFDVMSDEELVRSVWVLQDTLRGLAQGQGYKGVDMLFEAQHKRSSRL